MRAQATVGWATLAIGAAVAALLGFQGMHHPGPMTGAGLVAAGATGSAPPSGRASSTGAGGGARARARGGGAGRAAGGRGQGSAALRPTHLRLADSQWAPFAVPIWPGRLGAAAEAALDGFRLGIHALPGGGARLKVWVVGGTRSPAVDQVLPSGDRAYFLEGSMGDDGPGEDVNGNRIVDNHLSHDGVADTAEVEFGENDGKSSVTVGILVGSDVTKITQTLISGNVISNTHYGIYTKNMATKVRPKANTFRHVAVPVKQV